MKPEVTITEAELDRSLEKLKQDAAGAGYHLNPDAPFTRDLARGILTNAARYGYGSCPCRLASGKPENDRDIICPCDYRDPDLAEFGACYCGLYVSKDVASGTRPLRSIPERRPPPEARLQKAADATNSTGLPLPVWRCRVCGYLCAREAPPEICPICKVSRERFERFM